MRNPNVLLNQIGDVIYPTSCFPLRKCANTLTKSEDSFNKLPDDVLGLISSMLTMKEAARTSVLSRRWKNLWTFTTRSLEFDDLQKIYKMVFERGGWSPEVERRKFVDWVNQVLRLYQGPTLDKFRVCYDLDEENSKHDIENWISFALEKGVKGLELDLTSPQGYFGHGSYTLTIQFLRNYSIDSLTSLHLHFVEVTGEVLQYLLLNCPLLEVLSVEASTSLVNFKVPGPVVKLKYLEILYCRSMEYMDISGIDLVSFKYHGPEIKISFKDAPRLVEASIGGRFASFLVENVFHVSSYFSYLETLVLDVCNKKFMRFPRFSKMKNLKQLELWLDAYGVDSLLFCTSLLKASPMLQRFTLKIVALQAAHKRGKVKAQKVKRPHRCLKVVEIVGFVGCATDFEFVQHILENVVSLEKIIIDSRLPHALKSKYNCDTTTDVEELAARTRAIQLELVVPPGVELVII